MDSKSALLSMNPSERKKFLNAFVEEIAASMHKKQIAEIIEEQIEEELLTEAAKQTKEIERIEENKFITRQFYPSLMHALQEQEMKEETVPAPVPIAKQETIKPDIMQLQQQSILTSQTQQNAVFAPQAQAQQAPVPIQQAQQQKPTAVPEPPAKTEEKPLVIGSPIDSFFAQGVKTIECSSGTVKIKKNGEFENTSVILAEPEIQAVINKFSEMTKIPISRSLFKATLNGFAITAITSDKIGSRFLIQRIS